MFNCSNLGAIVSSISSMNSMRNSSSSLNTLRHSHTSHDSKEHSTDAAEHMSYPEEKFRIWSIDEKILYEKAKSSRAILKVLSEFEEYIKDDFDMMLDDYVKNKFTQFMKERYDIEFEFAQKFGPKLRRIKRF